MTYKEFLDWSADQTCAGDWSLDEAQAALNCVDILTACKRRERERIWERYFKQSVMVEIVNPVTERTTHKCFKQVQ